MAPEFEERTQDETLKQERCARRDAWELAKDVRKLKKGVKSYVLLSCRSLGNASTLFDPRMRRTPAHVIFSRVAQDLSHRVRILGRALLGRRLTLPCTSSSCWNVPGKYGPHGELFVFLIKKEPVALTKAVPFKPFVSAESLKADWFAPVGSGRWSWIKW